MRFLISKAAFFLSRWREGQTDGTAPFGVIHMSHADKRRRRRNMILWDAFLVLSLYLFLSLLTRLGEE